MAQLANRGDVVQQARGGLGVHHADVGDRRVGVQHLADALHVRNVAAGLGVHRMRHAGVAAHLHHAVAVGAVGAHSFGV